jgi:hypothetical protein
VMTISVSLMRRQYRNPHLLGTSRTSWPSALSISSTLR